MDARQWHQIRSMTPRRAWNLASASADKRRSTPSPRCMPSYIDVITTRRCNLRCAFCFAKDDFVSGGEDVHGISSEQFDVVARKLFPYARILDICSGGEPFLRRDFMDLLAIASHHGVSVGVVTNGCFVTKSVAQTLIEKRLLASLTFSYDGAQPETVESIRIGVKAREVLDNIRTFCAMKRKRGARYPVVSIQAAAMRRNIREIPDLVRHCADIGVEILSIKYLVVSEETDDDESLVSDPALAQEQFGKARELAHTLGVRLFLPPSGSARSPVRKCGFLWRQVIIDIDGTVYPCYYMKHGHASVGNIFEVDEFREIWNGDLYRRIRATANSDEPYFRFCKLCPQRLGWGVNEAHFKKLQRSLLVFEDETA